MKPNESISADASGTAQVLRQLCRIADVSTDALNQVHLTGIKPWLASSFHVGVLAQSTLTSAAYGAGLVGKSRGLELPRIDIDMAAAERECTGYFLLDGKMPDSWAPLSGLYECADGYVRIHANFEHHRNGACGLLGFTQQFDSLTKADISQAMLSVKAIPFEQRAAEMGLPIFAQRSFAQWDSTTQAQWLAEQPLFRIRKIGDASPKDFVCEPDSIEKPLAGVRVLDLTRIVAGPVCGRTLAQYGADVMLINSPKLPNIAHIADTSRGKRSALLDLNLRRDHQSLQNLVANSHIFVQGYRPGGMRKLGFSPEQLAQLSPGIISVSLSAFGYDGPWANRKGFDSLVQTAAGFNHAEAQAFGESIPKAMPVQILDFASGYLMAFASSVALLRQQQEGGSWQVDISLAQTAQYLRSLGRTPIHPQLDSAQLRDFLTESDSGFGRLSYMPHSVHINGRELSHLRESSQPGADAASWSD